MNTGKILQGYDGKVGWLMGASVGELVLSGGMLAQLVDEADWAGAANLAGQYQSAQTVERAEFHGFDCFVVTAERAGTSAKLYFEVETGLMRGRDTVIQTMGGPTHSISVVKRYETFGQLTIATETEMILPDHQMTQVAFIDDVQFDSVDSALFELPEEIRKQIE